MACFKPYIALFNLHTSFRRIGSTKLFGCFIYTYSSKTAFEKALYMSVCLRGQPKDKVIVKITRIVTNLTT